MSLLINIASPEYQDHIYEHYAELRRDHPAYHDATRLALGASELR